LPTVAVMTTAAGEVAILAAAEDAVVEVAGPAVVADAEAIAATAANCRLRNTLRRARLKNARPTLRLAMLTFR
ncbi:MAG: hypothetical protein WBP79_08530, partial [Candidatus Acidiferrales bacterium]